MRIFEAYDDTSIRIHFKEYIEGEGISMSRREQTYTRFGTYMSRIRGVLYDKMLLEAKDEADFKEKLSFIFHDKWKNHLGYPEMPDYFFRYLDFLHTVSAKRSDISIDGLSNEDDCMINDGVLTRFEERFLSANGELRIIANPVLIRQLKVAGGWNLPVNDDAIELCMSFYHGSQISMTSAQWKSLLEKTLSSSKKNKKRGDLSIAVKDAHGDVKVCNSFQAMEMIVSLAGADKVVNCNLKLNGQPIISKRVPKGKEATFKDIGNGYFLNNMGTVMDRFKVMRVLISLYRLPLEISLSKETAAKTPRKSRKTAAISPINPNQKPKNLSSESEVAAHVAAPEISNLQQSEEDFLFGKDGTLNLFEEM